MRLRRRTLDSNALSFSLSSTNCMPSDLTRWKGVLLLRGLPFPLPLPFPSASSLAVTPSLTSRPVSERAVETVAVTAAVPSSATRCFFAGRVSS